MRKSYLQTTPGARGLTVVIFCHIFKIYFGWINVAAATGKLRNRGDSFGWDFFSRQKRQHDGEHVRMPDS